MNVPVLTTIKAWANHLNSGKEGWIPDYPQHQPCKRGTFQVQRSCRGTTLIHRAWLSPIPRSRLSGHLINIHASLI